MTLLRKWWRNRGKRCRNESDTLIWTHFDEISRCPQIWVFGKLSLSLPNMYTEKLITSRKYFKMAARSGFPFFLTTLYNAHNLCHRMVLVSEAQFWHLLLFYNWVPQSHNTWWFITSFEMCHAISSNSPPGHVTYIVNMTCCRDMAAYMVFRNKKKTDKVFLFSTFKGILWDHQYGRPPFWLDFTP